MSPLGKMIFWILRWVYSKALSFVYGVAPKTIPTIKSSILMESATSLAGRIRKQKVSSVEVVRCYMERIQEVNDVLNCVVDERFEEALAEAEKADELIRSGGKSAEELEKDTPFLGVPFTAPESVGIRGLSNTMGSLSRKSVKAHADANVVALMRSGGAIPLACTNVTELCFAYETNNPVFGRTNNPYDTNRSAGGPFGGEASLIASSGSPIGVAPSVTLTSAFNGIFGHQTSAGLPGLMSRSAADLLPALKLLTKNSKPDLNLDEEVDLKKLKFYFPEGDSAMSEEMQKVMNHFKNSYKATVARVSLQHMNKAFSIWREKAIEVPRPQKLDLRMELIKSLFGRTQHTLTFLFTNLLKKNSSSNQDRSLLLKELQNLLGSDKVFICPSQLAFRHNESLVKGKDLSQATIFEILGLPMTHCPAGLDSDGLPVGFQVVAGVNQDRLTVAVAQEIGNLFGGWKPPPTHGVFTLKNAAFHNEYNKKVKTL